MTGHTRIPSADTAVDKRIAHYTERLETRYQDGFVNGYRKALLDRGIEEVKSTFSTGSMLTVALYGQHGIMDKRQADDGQDAARLLVEMAREYEPLKAGQRFEIEPFKYTVAGD